MELDSAPPKVPLEKLRASESRFQALAARGPALREAILDDAQQEILGKFAIDDLRAAKPAASPNG